MFNIPSSMVTTVSERYNIVPAEFQHVVFHGVDPASHYGSMESSCYMYKPQYVDYYERYTPNSIPKEHTVWKSFEHYKRSQASVACNPGGVMITADLINSNVYLDTAIIADPAVLYENSYGDPGMYNNGIPGLYDPSKFVEFIEAPPDLNGLIHSSLTSMLPTVKGQLSLLNSLFELKDIVSVKRSALLAKKALKTIQIYSSSYRYSGRGTLRQVIRSISDCYLQAKFNIQPLISDVQGLYQALKTYEKRINDLISREGKLRTVHYRKILSGRDCSNSGWSNERSARYGVRKDNDAGGYYTQGTVQEERVVVSAPTIFHAQIQYNYNYTQYQREHAHILAFLDALGVNLNPAIIWNALPWSFVVDWVIGVSRWLDDLKVGNMEPQINILQYCWSVKREREIFVKVRLNSRKYYSGYSLETYPPQYIAYPAIRETAYRRHAGLPNAYLFETSGLSSTEFSLGAALVLSRSRRYNRTRRR